MRYETVQRLFNNAFEKEGDKYILPPRTTLTLSGRGYSNAINGGGYGTGGRATYGIELEDDCFFISSLDPNQDQYLYVYQLDNISSVSIRQRQQQQQTGGGAYEAAAGVRFYTDTDEGLTYEEVAETEF